MTHKLSTDRGSSIWGWSSELHCLISLSLTWLPASPEHGPHLVCPVDSVHSASSSGDSWLQALPLWLHPVLKVRGADSRLCVGDRHLIGSVTASPGARDEGHEKGQYHLSNLGAGSQHTRPCP